MRVFLAAQTESALRLVRLCLSADILTCGGSERMKVSGFRVAA